MEVGSGDAPGCPDGADHIAFFNGLARLHVDARKVEKSAFKPVAVIKKNEDGAWIEDFLAFRDKFQHAPCAAKVMAAFEKLREEHTEPAKEAQKSARAAFQRGDQEGGYGKYQEIVDEYYAAPNYRMVKRWVSERR